MKFATVLLAAATTVAALGATACGSSASPATNNRINTISGLKGDTAKGKTVYTQNCATCHGSDAKSGSAAKNIPSESNSDAFTQILEGGGGMQSFSNLSDQDIADVWAYVLTLK